MSDVEELRPTKQSRVEPPWLPLLGDLSVMEGQYCLVVWAADRATLDRLADVARVEYAVQACACVDVEGTDIPPGLAKLTKERRVSPAELLLVQRNPLSIVSRTAAESLLDVRCFALLRPVCTKDELVDLIRDHKPTSEVEAQYLLLYFGASWCPPCKKILQQLPSVLRDRPSFVTACGKCDMDLAPSLCELFDVKIIPTFVLLNIGQVNSGSTDEQMNEAVVGKIQSSDSNVVAAFIEKHCARLAVAELDF